MRLKVKGQEVVVARIPQVPWSELNWVGKVTITDYFEQERRREGYKGCLFPEDALASHGLN